MDATTSTPTASLYVFGITEPIIEVFEFHGASALVLLSNGFECLALVSDIRIHN